MLDRLWARYNHIWEAFDGIVRYSSSFAGQASRAMQPSTETDQLRRGLLWEMAGRACLVAFEVSALGRGGFAFGAGARTRTLLELAVTADILATGKPEVLRRYEAQTLKTNKVAAASQAEFLVDLFGGGAADDAQEADDRARELDAAIQDFQAKDEAAGRMSGNFWWTRDELRRRGSEIPKRRALGFDDVARATPLGVWLPFYKYFNRPIHAGREAQADLYMSGSRGEVFLIGHMDSGFVDPAQVSLECLLHILKCFDDVAVSNNSPSSQNVSRQQQLAALRASADEVVRQLVKQDPRLNGEWCEPDQ